MFNPSFKDMSTRQRIAFDIFSQFYPLAVAYYQVENLSLTELKKFVLIYYTSEVQEHLTGLFGLAHHLEDAAKCISKITTPFYTDLAFCSLDETIFEIIVNNANSTKNSSVSSRD